MPGLEEMGDGVGTSGVEHEHRAATPRRKKSYDVKKKKSKERKEETYRRLGPAHPQGIAASEQVDDDDKLMGMRLRN
ncbi:hypothetical protein CDL15_Pgr005106 [Punica granatum]|uniref:Uncharacterized protein n=1 Tax=Punica granatum TaxID=22663 RepID=A0A218WNU0_PUNGR|nr:hypothetical protein CDL15_Pgr005106 [Punica granatum]